ncbi:MAG: hypothetical protein RL485_342, partial [Bacteroidota bacterium]
MKFHALASSFVAAVLFSLSAQAQSISLVQTANLSICTGDSLRLELTVSGSPMASTNSFKVHMAPGMPSSFTMAASTQRPIVKWQSILPLPVGTDTNSVGTKYAWVVIPKTITTSGFYSVVVKSTTPSLYSDTIQVLVNVSPTAEVSSILGGF